MSDDDEPKQALQKTEPDELVPTQEAPQLSLFPGHDFVIEARYIEEQHASLTSFESPIPSASELKKLQAVDPELVKFVLKTIGDEQSHRHEVEKKQLEIEAKKAESEAAVKLRGQLIGGGISLASLAMAGILIAAGQTAGAVAALFGALAPIIGANAIRAWLDRNKDKD